MLRDLKQLLSYSTIENASIVFIGLGLALAFKANGMAAALASTAALRHTLNHSLFKGLLFRCQRRVEHNRSRDSQGLGGTIHMMPQTTFLMLGGCLSISALPPLNGFRSDRLVFQAILLSPEMPQWGLKLMVPAVGATLALGAVLSAACSVRAYGIAFLGRPESAPVTAAVETDGFSRAAMGALLTLCLLLGIISGITIDAVSPVTQRLVGQLLIVPIAESRSSYSGLLVFVLITLSTPLVIEVIHRFASRAVRRGPTWDCNFPGPSSVAQYTADSFSQLIRHVFGPVVFQARERVDMPLPGDARPAGLTVTLRDLPWDAIYVPIAEVIWFAAEKLNHLTIRKYLSLVFVALIALLPTVALWALSTRLFVSATIGSPNGGGAA
jgi:hydrogenase-4 component B